MKKITYLLFVALAFTLSACGPNAEEEAEKARQDSIMEQQRLDSIAEVEAMEAEMLRIQDSIKQAEIIDSVKAAEKYKYNKKVKAEKKAKLRDPNAKNKAEKKSLRDPNAVNKAKKKSLRAPK